ncbi:MAG: AAA family ATPase [Magnetococcales bacterium]|nr:AAA family ATPase [Magnetococcales bacterium]
MDISEIKARLNSDINRVVEKLLPDGKRVGSEWEAGDTGGSSGKSLKVHMAGNKAGLWSDFASGESGDLISLWMACRGLGIGEALKEIKNWLGIKEPDFVGHKKSYVRPAKPKCSKPISVVRDYLTTERKISEEAITAYQVGEQDRTIVFPSKRDGELIFLKYLAVDRVNGKKKTWVSPDCEPCLFGWQAIPEAARAVTICEGELDAMTLWDYGYPALSVPFGGGKAGKHQWITTEFTNLDRFETIYLCFDQDSVGKESVIDLVDRLGMHRCRVVTLPRKDANQCRVDGLDKSHIDICFENSVFSSPEELKQASQYVGDVIESFYPTGDIEPGVQLPFKKLRGKVLFRAGELSLITGSTGSGKSQVLGQMCVSALVQGEKIVIASLEMSPKQTLKRMAKQISGLDKPHPDYLRFIHEFYQDKLFIFSLVGKSKVDRLLDAFEYARRRFGVTTFVIDSLMRLGVGVDDYKAQEATVYALTDFAINKNVHIHLVAHARKADTKAGFQTMTADDVKGTSEIASNAFNIIAISRDRKHEDKLKKAELKAGRGESVPELEELRDKPGVYLTVAKQRNGDWDGTIALWFDLKSYQYLEGSSQQAQAFLKYPPHLAET